MKSHLNSSKPGMKCCQASKLCSNLMKNQRFTSLYVKTKWEQELKPSITDETWCQLCGLLPTSTNYSGGNLIGNVLLGFLSLLTLAVSRWAHSSLVGETVVSWQLTTPISSGFALKLTHSGQQLMIPYKKSLVTRSLRTVRLYFEEILMIELKERTYI